MNDATPKFNGNDVTPRFNGNDATPDYYYHNRMPLCMESGLVVMRPESEKTLNLHQMLDDIRLLVENDFCFDMDLKTMPNSKEYTQEEAKQMAWIIGRVYSIAHCTTCEACQRKYLK